ncbi:MAG: DASS family sodium-coupled anion symporter [Sphingorhabdus sp.]|uniref:SLC13 family permease n=1 Tax=Sphingorhabdus sp. TaxID=1902408 RepID=UPI0025F9FEBB|nr:DASS family sodium-coupled anion symporter [Sphingorhabdus sp.]MCO4092848.1 DASS family sodium-coupled anion symporter [Sphingorhabdus sp.]
MKVERVGFWGGLVIFAVMLFLPAPTGMEPSAWHVAALTILMATYWMTQALPLTVTAFLPFLALPLMDIMTAQDVAKEYYSPILFLILGGAFLALTIERTGMHRRVALAILGKSGHSVTGLMIAFMGSTALLSMVMSNTSIALIMVPIAVAVLAAGGTKPGETDGLAGALIMGVAFAASIGGLGTLVGSPTNAIAAGLVEQQLGIQISFLTWMLYGVPVVIVGVPLCAFILMRVQNVTAGSFDVDAARASIGKAQPMSVAEKRLLPILLLVIGLWIAQRWLEPLGITDGSIAIAGSLLLFLIPDGTGRPLLTWQEADRAPWGVIMMFGGGLALAAGITQSGLAAWLGEALEPLSVVHPVIIAIALTALVILITEFASNVATASGVLPVVAGLVAATGADPWLMAMAASMAASWGFMMPSGTGPNAIAWASGHIALPKMVKAGFFLDLAGIPLIVGAVWLFGALRVL